MTKKPKAPKEPKDGDSYEWFTAESTAEIALRIIAAGPGAVLQIRRRAKDDSMLARVVDAEGNSLLVTTNAFSADGTDDLAVTDINDSHRCPPWCQ